MKRVRYNGEIYYVVRDRYVSYDLRHSTDGRTIYGVLKVWVDRV